MDHHLTPLDPDTRHKNLRYVSRAKLEQLLLDKTKRGWSLSFPFIGGGSGASSRKKTTRELLNEAAKTITKQGELTYEVQPEPKEWLLVRVLAVCGSAWPWAGGNAGLTETAWWVGRSEHLSVLAYGHRDHLLLQGKVPKNPEPGDVSTWWPSIDGGYRTILESVNGVVVSDNINAYPELDSMADNEATFQGLQKYFFDEGVKRAGPLVDRGVFEMLLRVHGVERSDETSRPTVFGSPLWVSEEKRPVPGTYWLTGYEGPDGVSAVASWDGASWSAARLEDHRSPRLRTPLPEPGLPLDPPSLNELRSLSL